MKNMERKTKQTAVKSQQPKQKVTITKSKKRRMRKAQLKTSQSVASSTRMNKSDEFTISDSINKLRIANSSDQDSYLACRVGFCSPRTAPSIPDGNSGRCLNRCFYSLDTITLAGATSSFYYTLLPWFPCFGIVYSSGTYSLNGGAATIAGNIYGVGVPNDLRVVGSGTFPGSTTTGDILNIASMRIVSISSRVTYTSSVLNAAGVYLAYENPYTLSPGTITTNGGAALPTSGSFLVVPTVTGTANAGTSVLAFDGQLISTVPSGTQLRRVESGCELVLNHHTRDFKTLTVPNYASGVSLGPFTVGSSNTPPATAVSILNLMTNQGSGNYHGGGVISYDNDWSPVTAQYFGLTPLTSYTIETSVCVELSMTSASPSFTLMSNKSENTPSILAKAQRIATAKGPVATFGQNVM